jgi:hypothetical protein
MEVMEDEDCIIINPEDLPKHEPDSRLLEYYWLMNFVKETVFEAVFEILETPVQLL